MKASKGSSRGSQSKGKRYVKNKLMIGDSRPNIMSKPDTRSTQMRLTASTAAQANYLIDQTAKGTKKIKMQDGSKFKKEVRARSPQAASVYGSKQKAMKNSYVRPPKTQTTTSTTQSGGMKSETGRKRNKGLI